MKLLVATGLGLLLVASLLMPDELSGAEIEGGRYLDAPKPVFETIPDARLAGGISVVAGDSSSLFTYNGPKVVVELPRVDNSAYAIVESLQVHPLGRGGSVLEHETEQGLYSLETHSTEIRFRAQGRNGLVAEAWKEVVVPLHSGLPQARRRARVPVRSVSWGDRQERPRIGRRPAKSQAPPERFGYASR